MLATRCPHCQTRFRVTVAQLELRAGLVRCGACREIFNGRDHLLGDLEEIEALDTPGQDADGRMTLIDFGSLRATQPAVTSKMQEELDELSKAIADLQAKPWRDTPQHELAAGAQAESASSAAAATTPNTPPAFVAQARRQRQSSGQWKFLLWLGLPLLLLALAAQLSYFFRADIAAYSPEAGRYLRAACARLGCEVKLPQHIDLLSLESSHLQELQGQQGQYTLTALLRNQADAAQAWPSLDLQLKAETGQPLIRKVVEPASYLNSVDLKKGIAAHAEHEIQLSFEMIGERPGGFSVTLFFH
ncbi:MAG: hypothetical protein RL618_1398 [Pseudomonadota bacterium]